MNHQDMARAWARNITGQTDKAVPAAHGNISPDSNNPDVINSYGWWEMARLIRHPNTAANRKNGTAGTPLRFLINGDLYSVSTSRHQSYVRNAIAQTGVPSITLPYSVLDEAGIDRATVAPLEVQADWNTETVITVAENPGRWEYSYGTAYDDFGGWQNSLTGEIVLRTAHYDSSNRPEVKCDHGDTLPAKLSYPIGSQFEGGYSGDEYKAAYAEYAQLEEDRAAHFALRHGEWVELKASTRQTGHAHVVSGRSGRTQWELVANPDPSADPASYLYERTEHRHWLGASLVIGTVSYREVAKCERHGKTTCTQCPRRAVTKTRKARFLSGFDSNETRPSYFFCELPATSHALTVEEAYNDLKPATVRTAESLGRTVHRQGDIFAVPLTATTTANLRKQGATISKATHILGTNHKATEVATIGTGARTLTYIRGTLTHAPEFRSPDHKRLTVGKQWHLAMKNTVPVSA